MKQWGSYFTECIPIIIGILLLIMPLCIQLDYYMSNITSNFIFCIITSLLICYSLFKSDKIIIRKPDLFVLTALSLYSSYCIFCGDTDFLIIFYIFYIFLFYLLLRNIKQYISIFYMLFLCGLIQSIIGVLQGFDIISSHHEVFKFTGSFNNPAMLAGYLVIILFISLYLLHISNNQYLKLLFLIGIIFIFSLLILTQSRASWIALICGVLWLLSGNNTIKKYLSRRFILKVSIISLLIISFAMLSAYSLKPDSANGRVLIWRVAIEMFGESPWIGNGVSSFQANYMLYQSAWFQTHLDSSFAWLASNNVYAFNEYIRLMCEVGLIGLLCYISFFFYILYLAFKTNLKTRYCGAALISFLVFSFFSYPLSNIPTILLIVFLVAVIVIESNTFKRELLLKKCCKIIFIVTIMVFNTFLCRDYIVRKKADNSLKILMIDQSAVNQKLYVDYYVKFRNSPDYVLCYAKNLFNDQQYEKSIPILKQAYRLSPSSHIAIDLGVCYQSIKNYERAEKMFITAEYMTPSQALPKYRLFKLYEETNQLNKATSMALSILNMRVKVINTTTLRIKKQIKDFLQQEEDLDLGKEVLNISN